MIFFKEKKDKRIEPQLWFAWYPVWAWDSEERGHLMLVWFERLMRVPSNTGIVKYVYYLKEKL